MKEFTKELKKEKILLLLIKSTFEIPQESSWSKKLAR